MQTVLRLYSYLPTLTGLFSRLGNRLRLLRLYPTVRNRVIVRTILLLVAGLLLGNGLILIPVALVIAAVLADEV